MVSNTPTRDRDSRPGDTGLGRALLTAAPLGTLLAVLGVYASARPIRDLFHGLPWTGPVVAALVVVGLIGTIGRALRVPRPLVPLLQLVGLVGFLTAAFTPDTAWLGLLPTGASLDAFTVLLLDARESIASSAPPAPSTAGVVFAVTAGVGLIALLTDAVAHTFSWPAVSGLPMVVPYLVAVANSATGLPARQFLAPMACWLGLLAAAEARAAFAATPGRHDAAARNRRRERDAATGARAGAAALRGGGPAGGAVLGALIGVAALTLGTGLAAVAPIAPTTVISDRLGISGGAGRVGFTASPDMLTDLADPNPTRVLEYVTDDPTTPPLRVAVSTVYRDGRWQPLPVREPVSSSPLLAQPPGLSEQVERIPRTLSAGPNRLAAPNLAAPAPLTEGVVTGAEWSMDPDTGIVAVGTMPTAYRLGYLSLAPTREQLVAGANHSIDTGSPLLDASALSEEARRTAEQVTAGAATSYDRAVALQNWFRTDGDFVYSLQLAPPPEGMSEREVARTSVDRFLASKRGYCVQFSTSMTLMARHLGIPARLASGFLPGEPVGRGSRVILSSDAHAWPELYFEGIGWLRFEPTPGVHAGPPPDYAPADEPAAPTATPTAAGTPTPTPTPTPQQPETQSPPDSVPAPGTTNELREFLAVAGRVLLGVLVVLAALAAAATPYLAGRHRRRNRLEAAHTPEEKTEAVWLGLREQLADLGYRASPALVLPEAAERLAQNMGLDTETAQRLDALALAVQNARYAPPATESEPGGRLDTRGARRARATAVLEGTPQTQRVAEDAEAVLAAARERTPWAQRLRGTYWPSSGRQALTEWFSSAVRGLRRQVRERGLRRRTGDRR